MPITTKFITLWFLCSFSVFCGIKALHSAAGGTELKRDVNAAVVLFAQGLGAFIAYALH